MKKENTNEREEQIKRIESNEKRFERVASSLAGLTKALGEFEKIRSDARELAKYYESPEWRDDFEDDEAGLIPVDIKRGVLSEDGVHNLLEEVDSIKERLLCGGAGYAIKRVSADFDWEEIPEIALDNILWLEDAGVRAFGRLCCDGENLYVFLRAVEKNIRAVNRSPLSPVHEDSCLEFFFSFEGDDRYFNFEINPNGCVCIQYGKNRQDRIDIVKKNAADYFDIKVKTTGDGWAVSYRIPRGFFDFFIDGFRFEGRLRANLYKCGDKCEKEHYLSWAPVGTKNPNFHRPEYFGDMIFQ